jgi:hypothetical protein
MILEAKNHNRLDVVTQEKRENLLPRDGIQ